jgi:hypothetical protein
VHKSKLKEKVHKVKLNFNLLTEIVHQSSSHGTVRNVSPNAGHCRAHLVPILLRVPRARARPPRIIRLRLLPILQRALLRKHLRSREWLSPAQPALAATPCDQPCPARPVPAVHAGPVPAPRGPRQAFCHRRVLIRIRTCRDASSHEPGQRACPSCPHSTGVGPRAGPTGLMSQVSRMGYWDANDPNTSDRTHVTREAGPRIRRIQRTRAYSVPFVELRRASASGARARSKADERRLGCV